MFWFFFVCFLDFKSTSKYWNQEHFCSFLRKLSHRHYKIIRHYLVPWSKSCRVYTIPCGANNKRQFASPLQIFRYCQLSASGTLISSLTKRLPIAYSVAPSVLDTIWSCLQTIVEKNLGHVSEWCLIYRQRGRLLAMPLLNWLKRRNCKIISKHSRL